MSYTNDTNLVHIVRRTSSEEPGEDVQYFLLPGQRISLPASYELTLVSTREPDALEAASLAVTDDPMTLPIKFLVA